MRKQQYRPAIKSPNRINISLPEQMSAPAVLKKRNPVTKAKVEKVGRHLGADFQAFDVNTLRRGMLVELEHGKKAGELNVTNDRLYDTARIALTHLKEDPKYYTKLSRMERKPRKA